MNLILSVKYYHLKCCWCGRKLSHFNKYAYLMINQRAVNWCHERTEGHGGHTCCSAQTEITNHGLILLLYLRSLTMSHIFLLSHVYTCGCIMLEHHKKHRTQSHRFSLKMVKKQKVLMMLASNKQSLISNTGKRFGITMVVLANGTRTGKGQRETRTLYTWGNMTKMEAIRSREDNHTGGNSQGQEVNLKREGKPTEMCIHISGC